MNIPERIEPKDLSDYLDVMTRAIFQAGLSWKLIAAQWPAFREAFSNFDANIVSQMTESDINRLCADTRITRSRRKIEATVKNAATMLELDRRYKGFKNYLHSFDSYEKLSNDIRKRFKFMGELSVYYFLFRVKEPVPEFNGWIQTIEGDHPRMREMVEHAQNG